MSLLRNKAIEEEEVVNEGINTPLPSPLTEQANSVTIEEITSNVKEQALRFNEGKPKWHLVHMKSLTPLVRVLEFGADKYGAFNWQKDTKREVILDSMFRHVIELMDGNEMDEESKQHHIGHILANAMFYNYQFEKRWKRKEINTEKQ